MAVADADWGVAEHRPAVGPVVAWVAAAVAAVAVASWGVALVGRSVTDARPSPLSAAQVDERLASAGTSSTTASTSATTPPARPGTTVPPDGEPGPPPTSAAPPPPSTAAPPVAVGEIRTYQLVGGTVSLRFEPAGVTVVYANPNHGFDVEEEPEAGGVRVELESETHRSRVTGWWDDGPRDRVDEQADGDDGGED